MKNFWSIHKSDFSKEYYDNLLKLHKRFEKKAEWIEYGRNRNVFKLKHCVVKLPKNLDGIADNDWEGSVSNGTNKDCQYSVQYAKTKMVYVNDIPVVFMEFIELATSDKIIQRLGYEPDWVWSVDGGQVGFNKQGKLFAYDYGIR